MFLVNEHLIFSPQKMQFAQNYLSSKMWISGFTVFALFK